MKPDLTPMQVSRTINPLWDLVRTCEAERLCTDDGLWHPEMISEHRLLRASDGDPAQRASDLPGWLARSRPKLVRKFSWAISDPDTVDFVAQHATGNDHPGVVEVGAGTGYWAYQLAQCGVDILAFDIAPPHLVANPYHRPLPEDPPSAPPQGGAPATAVPQRVGQLLQATDMFFDVQPASAAEAAAAHPERSLLICWPPLETAMGAEALTHYQGDRVIYLGEPEGGSCADASFFAQLDEQWTLRAWHQGVTWSYLHDLVLVYGRT